MKEKTVNIFLFAGVALCLLQVWLPQYYLTGDGPSHVYNAQVLHDLWAQKNTAFYSRFYNLVYQPNPNWFSTVAIALLMFIVNGVVAEKVFLTLYVMLYVSGFYLLLKKISGNISLVVLIVFILVFPQTLAKGFYNFSFSIAFYFWVVWCWLRFLERRSMANGLLFFLFTGLIFFTHLLAFGFAAFTCAALTGSFAVAGIKEETRQKAGSYFLQYTAFLALLLAPFLVLMRWFTEKEGGMQMQLRPHLYRLVELVEGKYLVNVTHTEDFLAEAAGLVLLVLFCFSFLRLKKITIHKYDGFLLSLLFVLFVYLCFPETFLGRLILISMRAQMFVYVLMACCIAYRFPAEKIKITDAVIVLLIFLVFGIAEATSLLTASPEALAHNYTVLQMIGISIGLQLGVLVIVFCCAACKLPFEKVKNGGAILLFGCFIALACARAGCLLSASAAVADYTSAEKKIRPYSVVLPLDFAPCGKDEHGQIISDRNFLFYHASQYMCLEKPMIILDNYEANMGYFPLRWTNKTNPYFHLSKGAGIEAQPPYAAIEEYRQTTGVNIDYVLMWCYDSSYLKNEDFRKLYGEIDDGYHVVYSSGTGRTMLFERNQATEINNKFQRLNDGY